MSIKVRDVILGEGKPKVCVPVVETTHDAIINSLKQTQDKQFDLVELRIDYFENLSDESSVKALFADIKNLNINKPIILTCRSMREGGQSSLENKEYYHLYEQGIESKAFDIYDVEVEVGTNYAIEFKNLIHQAGCFMLMSYHDFKRTPEIDTLIQRFDVMESYEADIYKIAVMPEDQKDVLSLMNFTNVAREKYNKPIVTMSMSPLGLVTRLSGEQFGSSITFASDGKASAPGQINYQDMVTILDVIHNSIEK